MTTIHLKTYEELCKDELYVLLKLRADVFVYEQECIFADIDGEDPQALHVLAYDGETLVGTIRLLPDQEAKEVELGRVVIATDHRGQGVGTAMMKLALGACQDKLPDWPINLAAQQHLEGYYKQFGFETVGGAFTYLKDHVPHVPMKRGS